ncbi:MAG TPA: hypothetical protein VGZ26_02175 [Pirellulales bacterium]|jgi:hypothetical protein|nr:hypothetical protein [Pirellulales bacterium]
MLKDSASRAAALNDSLASYDKRLKEYEGRRATLIKDTTNFAEDVSKFHDVVVNENAKRGYFPQDKISSSIDSFVGQDKYKPTPIDGQPGRFDTKCNFFVKDLAKSVFGDGSVPKELSGVGNDGKASAIYQKLSASAASPAGSWSSMPAKDNPVETFRSVQAAANEHRFVVAATPDHVAAVVELKPGTKLQESVSWGVNGVPAQVPYIAQAGKDASGVQPYIGMNFGWQANAKDKLIFFIYDPAKASQ